MFNFNNGRTPTPQTWDVERAKFSDTFVVKQFNKSFKSIPEVLEYLKPKLLDNDRVEIIDLHEKRISDYKRQFGKEKAFEVTHFFKGQQLTENV